MVSDWKFCKIGDVVKIQGGYAFKSKDFSDTGIPVIKIKNVRKRDIDLNDVARVSQEVAEQASSFLVKSWDVLISMTGSGPNAPASIVGRVARHSGENDLFLINQRVGRFLIKETEQLDQRFLYYLFSEDKTQLELLSIATGSANQVNISGKQIESIEVNLPPLPEQKAIAHILGSLDDKIELNHQMNETLKAMAQALFKSWFVDFDPVLDNALAAGHAIPDEFAERAKQRQTVEKTDNSDIHQLFPDEFEFTEEVGWIPKGWDSGTLGDFAILGNGKTSPDRAVGEIPVFGSNGKIGDCDESNRDNTIIIGRVGSYCGSLQYYPSKCWITDNAMSAEMENKEHNIYLFQLLSRDNLNDRRTGSGQPLLNQSILRSIKTILPSVLVIDEYSRIANSLYEKIYKANGNNETLAKLRDTLLPKLMSGELSIPDAAAMVDEVL